MHEFALYANPWGFDLSNIALPVTLWQGGRDQVVPPAHARYLAAALPRSDLRLLPNEGHFSLPINYMHEILGRVGVKSSIFHSIALITGLTVEDDTPKVVAIIDRS